VINIVSIDDISSVKLLIEAFNAFMLRLTDWSRVTMSRRSESVTGGGGGSGLEGSSLNWGERSDRGLKYPEGDVVGKLGSKGVVNVDEDCDEV